MSGPLTGAGKRLLHRLTAFDGGDPATESANIVAIEIEAADLFAQNAARAAAPPVEPERQCSECGWWFSAAEPDHHAPGCSRPSPAPVCKGVCEYVSMEAPMTEDRAMETRTEERPASLAHERHVTEGVRSLYCEWCGTWPPEPVGWGDIRRAAENVSDRRTLLDDGFWVSRKEMRALDLALGRPDIGTSLTLSHRAATPEADTDEA